MGQILSQSEVEAILTGLDLGSKALPTSASSTAHESPDDVTLYDFEHPIPLRPSQLDTVRLAAAAVSQSLQSTLTGVLHSSVVVNFIGVEQSTFHEYLATSEQPACLAVFESATSSDTWLLDISRTLAFTLIDCLLGGRPSEAHPTATLFRSFTDLETCLIDKTIRAILPELIGSFSSEESLRMIRLTSDGGSVAEATSNEAVALISFEVICGPSRGLMQLCVPWKYAAQSSGVSRMEPRQLQELMRTGAIKVPVTATVRIARLKLSTKDLAGLSQGDILLTDASPAAEISLEVDGREIFRGTPGQIRDRKVIRLTTPVASGGTGKRPRGDALADRSDSGCP